MSRWILESDSKKSSARISDGTTAIVVMPVPQESAVDAWSRMLESDVFTSPGLTKLFSKWIVIFYLVVGCGGSVTAVAGRAESRGNRAVVSTPSDSKPKNARAPNGSAETRASSGSEETVNLTTVSISRADLLVVLEEGIPRFLQNVKVEPRFLKGRFFGWQVISLFPDDPRFNRSVIVPGDVVVDVNGRSIERPESLKVLWDGLASESNLRFTVFRESRTYVVDCEITD